MASEISLRHVLQDEPRADEEPTAAPAPSPVRVTDAMFDACCTDVMAALRATPHLRAALADAAPQRRYAIVRIMERLMRAALAVLSEAGTHPDMLCLQWNPSFEPEPMQAAGTASPPPTARTASAPVRSGGEEGGDPPAPAAELLPRRRTISGISGISGIPRASSSASSASLPAAASATPTAAAPPRPPLPSARSSSSLLRQRDMDAARTSVRRQGKDVVVTIRHSARS